MIEFIQKVLYLLSKKNNRTRVRCERQYLKDKFGSIIEKDDQTLREEMAKLKAIKEPKSETKKRILDLDREITEIMMYRTMVQKGDEKEAELDSLIRSIKANLWK